MILHEDHLLAEDTYVTYFCLKLGKMSQHLSSVAVVIDALRVLSLNNADEDQLYPRFSRQELKN